MQKLTKRGLWRAVSALLACLCLAVFAGCTKKKPSPGSKVTHLDSLEQVQAFIEKIYEEVGESNMPMMVEHRELDLADADALEFNTGLTSAEGIRRVVVSESAVGSIAYSMLYVCVKDGADAAKIQAQILENINPAKWICVSAEQEASMTLGGDIFFVMGDAETVQEMTKAAKKVAEAEFSSIGAVQEKRVEF